MKVSAEGVIRRIVARSLAARPQKPLDSGAPRRLLDRMLDNDTLNPPQREAVTKIEGPLMILAGAGTGKTRVITYRIAYMLQSAIDAKSIVALSFTNKAAREMSERATHLVGKRAKDVWLGTFHSFCLAILRRYPHAAKLVP